LQFFKIINFPWHINYRDVIKISRNNLCCTERAVNTCILRVASLCPDIAVIIKGNSFQETVFGKNIFIRREKVNMLFKYSYIFLKVSF